MMDKSKLISNVIAKLKIAYPYYFKDLNTEELTGLISMYQSNLSIYDYKTVLTIIDEIIKTSRFMPSMAEIIEKCEKHKAKQGNVILEKMLKDGYFKKSEFGELSGEQEIRNYEKSLMWLENKLIPNWLLNDMKKYGYEDNLQITNNPMLRIGTN